MDVTGLTENEIKEKVTQCYFIFKQIEEQLQKEGHTEPAELAKRIIKEDIMKQLKKDEINGEKINGEKII